MEVTRRDKPVAVLISVAEYERLTAGRPDLWQRLKAFRKKHPLEGLDVDEIFKGARGRALPFADGQIAAIAKVHGLTIVTSNGADFAPFEGLAIEDWRA